MRKVLVLWMFACSLQVMAGVDRNFVGAGKWSDNAGNSGSITSQLHLGWLSGIKLDYRVKLDGDEALHAQMIVQPHSDNSCTLLTLDKERMGACRADEEIGGMVFSYSQQGVDKAEQIELTFVMGDAGNIDITVKKISDGSIVTWQDKLSEVSE